VIAQKHFAAGLPTSYPGIGTEEEKRAPGITKNRPVSYWTQERLPTMTTKVGFQENLDYNIPDIQATFKPNSNLKDQTNYGLGSLSSRDQYSKNLENSNFSQNSSQETPCVVNEITIGTGPIGAIVPLTGQRSETYMSQDNNIKSKSDCNSEPIGNPHRSSYGNGNILSNWYVNETNRGTVAPQNLMQLNLTQERNGFTTHWLAEDSPNTTMKETTEFSFVGNVNGRTKDGTTFWTYDDISKTTMKETTEYAFTGNVNRSNDGYTTHWNFSDEPSTTMKETTTFAYSGNVLGQNAETNRFMFMGKV